MLELLREKVIKARYVEQAKNVVRFETVINLFVGLPVFWVRYAYVERENRGIDHPSGM